MPVITLLTGKIDFSNLFIALDGGSYKTLVEAQKAGAATLNYGTFISELINFLIMAFVVFMIVKFMNKLRRKEEPDAISEIPLLYWGIHTTLYRETRILFSV